MASSAASGYEGYRNDTHLGVPYGKSRYFPIQSPAAPAVSCARTANLRRDIAAVRNVRSRVNVAGSVKAHGCDGIPDIRNAGHAVAEAATCGEWCLPDCLMRQTPIQAGGGDLSRPPTARCSAVLARMQPRCLGHRRRSRLPPGDGPGTFPRLGVVSDAGEPAAQLNCGRQLALLFKDSTDRSSIGFGDNKHGRQIGASAAPGNPAQWLLSDFGKILT
jgi:hypothetical protein